MSMTMEGSGLATNAGLWRQSCRTGANHMGQSAKSRNQQSQANCNQISQLHVFSLCYDRILPYNSSFMGSDTPINPDKTQTAVLKNKKSSNYTLKKIILSWVHHAS